MTLLFTLSMPGNNSWNGRWSGQGKAYTVTRKFSGKKGAAKAQAILDKGYYGYSFGDGWRAGIEVKCVGAAEIRAARKASRGFCGYDWMVDSILSHGAIYASHDQIPKEAAAA